MNKFILLIFLILISGAMSGKVFAQDRIDLPESLGRSVGIYQINLKNKPSGFENFEYFFLEEFPNQDTNNPERDSDSKVFIRGKVRTNDGKVLKFKKASIKIIKINDEDYYQDIEFETVKVGGISYQFKGKFSDVLIQEKGGVTDFTDIRGTLTKYKNGEKIAEIFLPFFQNAEE